MCPNDEILSTYMDKELCEPDQSLVQKHVASCPACRRRVGELEKIKTAFIELTPGGIEEARGRDDLLSDIAKASGKKGFMSFRMARVFAFSQMELIGALLIAILLIIGAYILGAMK